MASNRITNEYSMDTMTIILKFILNVTEHNDNPGNTMSITAIIEVRLTIGLH